MSWSDFGPLGIIPQADGHPLQWLNCGTASEAMRAAAERHGIRPARGAPWLPTAGSVRDATNDVSGGVTPQRATGATSIVYGIPSDIRITDWSVVIAKLRAGFAASFLHSYGPITDAGWSGSPGFRGNHSSVFVGVRGTGSAIECLTADPLYDGRRLIIPRGPQWIGIGTLKRASRALRITSRQTLEQRNGSNAAYVVLTTIGWTPLPPPPPSVVLRYGATELKRPRRYKTIYNRTNLRSAPRLRVSTVARVVDRGYTFAAYQWVSNADGKWVGNKDGSRWLFFDGVKFHNYI